jgi:2-polyprenyl-6-methoxyphenol hydroxylase-like FAD-dependent oxidoreductase
MSSSFKVLVIGGGSCGLVLAQGLRKSSIPYVLYEKDSKYEYQERPRDWGLLLHWGQEYTHKCLPEDLWDRRKELYVDPFNDYSSHSAGLVWDGKSGQDIKKLTAVTGAVRVSRRKMRRLLSEELNIEYSKRLQKIETKEGVVTAYFEDGTSAIGSVLIGCDGGHSKVREYVVGIDAAKGFDTGYTMINTWKTLPAKTALDIRQKHPIISQAQHPDGYPVLLIAILDMPSERTPPDQIKFQIYAGWRGNPRKSDLDTNDKAINFFKSIFKHYAEPFYSVGEALSENDIIPIDDGWNFKPNGTFEWNNHDGMVTIAGDAAHSMLPHRGQGLNYAIMDAAGLMDALTQVMRGEKSLKEAIKTYEDEMRPRATAEVELTYQQMLAAASKGDWKDTPMYKIGFEKVYNS